MHYRRNMLFVVVTSTLSDNGVQRAPSKVLSFHMSNARATRIYFFFSTCFNLTKDFTARHPDGNR